MRPWTRRSSPAMLSFACFACNGALALTPNMLDAQAAPAPAVIHVNAAQLSAFADTLASVAALQPGRQVPGRPLGRDSVLSAFFVRRGTSSRPEMHERVAEVYLVQAGRAVFVTGGRADGARLMEPGEWNGGQLVQDTGATGGGTPVRRTAGTGDVIVIPADVPHQIEVAPGESVTYMVVKVKVFDPTRPDE